MSEILAFYTALAAQEVTVDGVTVAARNLDALPQHVDTGAMPIRLLLPFGTDRAAGEELNLYTTAGRTASIRWRVTDLLFWQAAAQGSGLANVAPKLVAYKAAYVEMLRQMRLPRGMTLVGLEVRPGDFEWPQGAKPSYFGVSCTLTVEEVLR